MKKLFLLFLLVSVAFLVAEAYPPLKAPGEPDPTSTVFSASIGSFQSNWQGTKSIYVFNGSGGSLAAGDLVIWQTTVKTPVAVYDASAAGAGTYDTCTIADSIDTFKWYKLKARFSNASNDSIVVQGLDSANVAQVDTFAFASGAGVNYSGLGFWRKVNLIYTIACNDSVEIVAVPYMTITTTTNTGNSWTAGVVAGSYADDSLTKIDIEGIVDVKLLGATTEITPGAVLTTGSSVKYGLPTTSNKPSFGTALSAGNTNTTYKCFINTISALTYTYVDSVLFANGYKITNPHADTAYHDEAVNKFSGDIRVMGNDIFFGNGASIKNKHADSLDYDEAVHDFNDGKIISDAYFTLHVNAFDFEFAASGVTHIAAEACMHPTAANEAIYASITIPFNLFGATVIVDTIIAFFNTDASGDDFDFALIRSDHDGSLTIDVDKDDIGNGGTGADSLAFVTTDITLSNHPYHIEVDVNNAGAATDVKIYGFKLRCHTQ